VAEPRSLWPTDRVAWPGFEVDRDRFSDDPPNDVDEATVLADRVLVMAGGRIASDVPIPFTHPRRRNDPLLEEIREELLELLGVQPAV
jgi:hypothetical protein